MNMRTVEECYTYVIARRNELVAKKRKRCLTALKVATPVCGIAVIVGFAVILKNEENRIGKCVYSSESCITSADNNSVVSSGNNLIDSSMNTEAGYNNVLNIGEIEIAESSLSYLYDIPPLFEMERDEVLKHFGLCEEFELSSVVPELYEVIPKNRVLNVDGKHGLHRVCSIFENGDCVWEDVAPIWDNDEFDFENTNGTQSAKVIFQNKYNSIEVIPDFRNEIATVMDDGSFSTAPFYALPPSIIAGVEMRVAKRNIGGYYAEFKTDSLCVGLITNGISDGKTVAILEYLAEYVGTANLSANNDICTEEYNVFSPALLF